MPSRSGPVHVATTTRHYKGKIYTSHLLRRSFRVGQQVKHETLGNLSHLPDSLIDIIRRSLAGESFVPAAETFLVERSAPTVMSRLSSARCASSASIACWPPNPRASATSSSP